MRRVGWGSLAALVAAVGAHAWYVQTHRAMPPYDAEIRWLSQELQLTAEQVEQVRAVHEAQCPDMDNLHAELQQQRATAAQAPECVEVEQRCAESTERLIAAVSAVLTPEQNRRYLELVQPCLRREQGKAAP